MGDDFQYAETLTQNDIRLLSILPGPWTDQIRIKFSSSLIVDAIPYAALSYTWESGDENSGAKVIKVRSVDAVNFQSVVAVIL